MIDQFSLKIFLWLLIKKVEKVASFWKYYLYKSFYATNSKKMYQVFKFVKTIHTIYDSSN